MNKVAECFSARYYLFSNLLITSTQRKLFTRSCPVRGVASSNTYIEQLRSLQLCRGLCDQETRLLESSVEQRR